MADTRNHPILNYLRQVLGAPTGGSVTDADLLRRFVDARDEAAFELLLWRHGGMVAHVCRQILGEGAAAEDAFQAAFLVFVRKAGSISRRESLGGWLYRVAYRIALKARAEGKRQTSTDKGLDRVEAPADTDTVEQYELRRMICEEVDRLPAKYRAPIVACYFEGRTHEEAAHQLGWPRGTVAGRLARARDLLHRRLVRRGVTMTMGAFAAAFSVRTAQAALTTLIESTMQTAKLFAAGQSASAAVSPHIVTLAEGVLKAMYWTRVKIVMVVLLIAGFGGVGATLWARQRSTDGSSRESVVLRVPEGGRVELKQAEEPSRTEARQPDDSAKLARDMVRSRLNLKQLALAMHNYADTYNSQLPRAATTDRNGKALLSWRVALLPYLDEYGLYKQFKLDEPWDSPHNKKLLSKMPAVFAPPGAKTRQPYSTFYQVFVSAGSPARDGRPGRGGMPPGMGPMTPGGGMPGGGPLMPKGIPGAPGGAPAAGGPMGPPGGMMGGPPGGMMGAAAGALAADIGPTAAFVKGQTPRMPSSFTDGTSNTILIIEAGNPVPWTKPEDLRYAEDEPLPELGGLFPDVFHAAAADGWVHTLTKKYDEKHLRYAITSNDGMVLDWAKIEGRSRRTARTPGGDGASAENWQHKNDELRKEVEQARERIRLLKEEREVQRELSRDDPRIQQLKEDNAHLQTELKKLHAEIEALNVEIRRLQKPGEKKTP